MKPALLRHQKTPTKPNPIKADGEGSGEGIGPPSWNIGPANI